MKTGGCALHSGNPVLPHLVKHVAKRTQTKVRPHFSISLRESKLASINMDLSRFMVETYWVFRGQGLMIFAFRWLLPVAASLVLTSCGSTGKPPSLAGASCYPDAARAWIGEGAKSVAMVSEDPGGTYSIYLDGSASMVGYIRGGSADSRPLADLVGMMPTLQGIDRGKVEIVRFDRRFTVLAQKDLGTMQVDSGYLCPPSNANCDAQESHIDQALAKIASSDAGGLSVVVSDLWLANSEVLTTDGVALSKPLADIFASGRSVAVYGFESAYSGRVNDLPSGNRNRTASRRYLFMIAVGPLKRLEALHSAMETAPSRSIAADLNSGKAHYSLFTLEPSVAAASGEQSFALAAKSPLTKTSFLPVRSGVKIQQFHLDKGQALRAAGAAGASWSGVATAHPVTGAVWEGSSDGHTSLFRMTGNKCLPNGGDWRAEGELNGGWGSEADYQLDPAQLAALPAGKYLLVGTVQRTSLLSPNPATQWMRDWSFDSITESKAVNRPVMPTLNLAETARLLEVTLLKAAQRKPMNIGGFAVAVEIN